MKRKKFIRFLAILLCLVMLGGGGVQATEKMDEIQTEEIAGNDVQQAAQKEEDSNEELKGEQEGTLKTGNDPETGTVGETENEQNSGIVGTGKTECGSAEDAELERNGGTEAGGQSESDRGSGSDLKSDTAAIADGTPERIGGAGSRGLGELNEELGTWLKAAELEPGNETVLTFTVGLDGESTGNGYMDREAVFQYGFRAEYAEPETKEAEKPPVKQVTARSAFTGDTANGAVWGIVLILAAGTAGAAAVKRKNGKNRTGERK